MYSDPNGEFLQYLIGALVGGTINWVANGCKFSWEGLSYFGAGAIAGIAIAAAPASFVSISAALSGVNSAINQGFNKGWSNINFQQVAGNTLMGGATAFAGGQLGKAIATPLENALGSVSSPLRFMIGSEITNTIIGGFVWWGF